MQPSQAFLGKENGGGDGRRLSFQRADEGWNHRHRRLLQRGQRAPALPHGRGALAGLEILTPGPTMQ